LPLQIEHTQDQLAKIQVELLEHFSKVIEDQPTNPLVALAEELLSHSGSEDAQELLKAVDWQRAREVPLSQRFEQQHQQ
jgi:hypothetical protein